MVLLGPSGCGKTTLLRMIAGLELPDGGSIAIGGRDVTDLPARERGLSMVFQSYADLPAPAACGENIALRPRDGARRPAAGGRPQGRVGGRAAAT